MSLKYEPSTPCVCGRESERVPCLTPHHRTRGAKPTVVRVQISYTVVKSAATQASSPPTRGFAHVQSPACRVQGWTVQGWGSGLGFGVPQVLAVVRVARADGRRLSLFDCLFLSLFLSDS